MVSHDPKSKVIIGTWSLSGDFGPVKLSTIQNVLEYCYELGFSEFDTAPNYGNGFMEFCLGKTFEDYPDVIINTKIGNQSFGNRNFDIKNLKKSFEDSLKRLNRDYVNILFLHNPRNEVPNYESIIDFMITLKDKGLIKLIGISKARHFDYTKIVNLELFDVIQEDINLLNLEALNHPKPQNTILMARSPLANSLLSGKITRDTKFPISDYRYSWLKDERLFSILKRTEVIKKVINMELPKLARRFLLNNSYIDKIIFGVKQTSHIDDLLEDIKTPEIDSQTMEKLTKLYNDDFGLKNERELSY